MATCLPAPGSFFPLGTTTVNCSATDVAGNPATPTAFTITVNVGAVSASQSSISFDNHTHISTDGGTGTFTITARDAFGNVISGASVVLTTTGSNNTFTPPNPILTGSNGQAQIGLQSTTAESKTVSATIDGTPITQTVSAIFSPGAPTDGAIVASTTTPEASLTPGTAVDLTITVTDSSGNLVQDNTSVALITDFGVISESGNTTNGVVHRTLTGIGKGTAHLTFSGLTATGDITIDFVDTTKPVITRLGVTPVAVQFREAYSDAGATAVDNIDGNITSSIVTVNLVDTSDAGINVSPINTTDKIVATYIVTYDVDDASGNPADQVTRTVNVIDTVAPVISITSDATSAGALKIGDTIIFTVTPTVTEPTATVSGSYNGQELTWSTSDGGATYTATYTVVEDDATQTSPLQITGVTMTDEAGNISVPTSGSDVAKTIDAIKPLVTSVDSDGDVYNIATVSPHTIRVTFSEDISNTPSISIHTDVAVQTVNDCSDGNPRTFCFDYSIPVGQDDTTHTIYISDAQDLAGNTIVEDDSHTFVVDTVAPDAPTVVLPIYINTGNQDSLTITGTGEADAAISYTISDGADPANTVSGTGTVDGSGNINITGVHVSGLEDGPIGISMTLIDAAGNPSSAGTETAIKETIKPTLTSLNSDGRIYKAGTYTITATFSEPVTSPEIAVAYFSTVGTCADIDSTAMSTSDGTTYTYELTVDDACDGALGTVTISGATDVAGNIIDADSTHTYIVDTLAPSFGVTSPATGAFIKADFSVTYTLSEQLESGYIDIFGSPVHEYTFVTEDLTPGTHTIPGSSFVDFSRIDGHVYSISFNGTDLAGNSTTSTNTDITYDVTNPNVLDVNSEQADGAYKAGVTIPIDVTMSETVSVTGAPRLLLNSAPGRYAEFAGATDPSAGGETPLATLENVNKLTDNSSNDSEIDTAIRSDVVHRVYVRDGNIYYSNSAGVTEELVGAGSSPSIAVGPNGIPQVAYISGSNIMFTIRSGGSWQPSVTVGVNGGWGGPSLDVDTANKAHVAFTYDTNGSGYPDIVYSNNTSGSFSEPLDVLDSDYRSYHDNPVLKVDNSSNYHILGHYHRMDCGGWGCDHSYSIDYTTNAAGRSGSGVGRNINPGKNSLTIDSLGNPNIVYSDGNLYYGIISVDGTWSESTLTTGTTPSITSSGTTVGVSYDNSGVKFIKNSGAGFGAPETIDADGTNQSIVMGTYTYITYLKSDGADQEVYEANNRPASSGAGSTLTFNYVVQPGDTSTDLDYFDSNSLDLNGGTIKDLAGNDASLTLATPGAANSLGFNKNIVIDTTAPTVELSTTAVDPTNVSPIPMTATFSEPVTGFEATDISVTNGTVTDSSFDGDGTTYTFTVTPTTDGLVTVDIAGDVAADAASNGNTAATPLSITYDTTSPEVAAVTFKEAGVDSDGLVKAGDVLTINVEFNEPMAISPVPTVAISDANTLAATEMTRLDETHYTYDYTVTAPGEGDATVTIADGTDLATNPLVVYSSAKFVVDNTKPVIDQQSDITEDADSLGGKVINYSVSATDNYDDPSSLFVVCSPESGTKFPVNETTLVTCNVSDQAGNAADPMTFNVTINPDEIARLIVTADTPINTTQTSTVTISGQDQYGNPTLNQSGTAAVVSADNGGALGSGILILTNGVATTTLTKSIAGIVNVNATSGILIPGTTQVEFTKADTDAPTISSFSPDNNATEVAINAPLFIIFNEPLDSHSVTSDNIKLMKVGTGEVPVDTQVSATVSLVEGGRRVNIVTDSNLEYDTSYYFVVSGVQDESGNSTGEILNHGNSGFTTTENTADLTLPTVVGQSPLVSTTEVAVNVHPYVDFSESMKSTTITAGNVELKKIQMVVLCQLQLVLKMAAHAL